MLSAANPDRPTNTWDLLRGVLDDGFQQLGMGETLPFPALLVWSFGKDCQSALVDGDAALLMSKVESGENGLNFSEGCFGVTLRSNRRFPCPTPRSTAKAAASPNPGRTGEEPPDAAWHKRWP
jgi:hypothetical protein